MKLIVKSTNVDMIMYRNSDLCSKDGRHSVTLIEADTAGPEAMLKVNKEDGTVGYVLAKEYGCKVEVVD